MSKRFGRNQKRKMKEKLGQVIGLTISQATEIAYLKQTNDIFLQMDRELAQMLGSASALRLMTQKIMTNEDMLRPDLNVMSGPMYAFRMDTGAELQKTVTYHRCKQLITAISYDPVQYRSYIKVIVGNETEAAMYVDSDYLMRGGLTPRDIEYLSRSLAGQLARFINEKYDQRRNQLHVQEMAPHARIAER